MRIYFLINSNQIDPFTTKEKITKLERLLDRYCEPYRKDQASILKKTNTFGSYYPETIKCFCTVLSYGYYETNSVGLFNKDIITVYNMITFANSLEIPLSCMHENLFEFLEESLTYFDCLMILEVTGNKIFEFQKYDHTTNMNKLLEKSKEEMDQIYHNIKIPAINEYFKCPNAKDFMDLFLVPPDGYYNGICEKNQRQKFYLLNMASEIYIKKNVKINTNNRLSTLALIADHMIKNQEIYKISYRYENILNILVKFFEILQNPEHATVQDFMMVLFFKISVNLNMYHLLREYFYDAIVLAYDAIDKDNVFPESCAVFLRCMAYLRNENLYKIIQHNWDFIVSIVATMHYAFKNSNRIEMEFAVKVRSVIYYMLENDNIDDFYFVEIKNRKSDELIKSCAVIYKIRAFDTLKLKMRDATREKLNQELGIYVGRLTKCAIK